MGKKKRASPPSDAYPTHVPERRISTGLAQKRLMRYFIFQMFCVCVYVCMCGHVMHGPTRPHRYSRSRWYVQLALPDSATAQKRHARCGCLSDYGRPASLLTIICSIFSFSAGLRAEDQVRTRRTVGEIRSLPMTGHRSVCERCVEDGLRVGTSWPDSGEMRWLA